MDDPPPSERSIPLVYRSALTVITRDVGISLSVWVSAHRIISQIQMESSPKVLWNSSTQTRPVSRPAIGTEPVTRSPRLTALIFQGPRQQGKALQRSIDKAHSRSLTVDTSYSFATAFPSLPPRKRIYKINQHLDSIISHSSYLLEQQWPEVVWDRSIPKDALSAYVR